MYYRLRRLLEPLLGVPMNHSVDRLHRRVRCAVRWPVQAIRALMNRPPSKLSVQIQTTSLCNGSCGMCPYQGSWHQQHPGVMTDALFEKILQELGGFRIGRLCLYLQNEPFLDPAMLARLECAVRELDFETLNIATNASALTPEASAELGALLTSVPHEIWVSFHGIDAQSYGTIMGLDFERVLGNVVGLLRVADTHGLNVTIRGAGYPAVRRADCPVHFSPEEMLSFWGEVVEMHSIERPPRVYCFPYHDRAGSLAGSSYEFGNPRRRLVGFTCSRADSWLHVLYNGDVILCCNDYQRRTVIGNVDTHAVGEVLASPAYRRYRLQVMGLRSAPADFICKACGCPGG